MPTFAERDSHRPTSLQIVLGLLVAVAFADLTFRHPSATRIFTWPSIAVAAVWWVAPIVLLLWRRARVPAWSRPGPLVTAGLVLLAATTLVSAAASPFAVPSLLRVWPTLNGVALFFLVYHELTDRPDLTRPRMTFLARLLAFAGAAIAIASLVAWRWHVGGAGIGSRNEFPFGHSNYTAGAMILALPWIVLAACRETERASRTGWVFALLVALVTLLSTSSRGGVLAIGVTAALFAGTALLRARWSRPRKLAALGAVIGVVAVAVLTNQRLRDSLLHLRWDNAALASNAQHSGMAHAGILLGRERPLVGWGPGIVPLIFPKVRAELGDIGGIDNVLQLHDTPLQIWASLGTSGLIALGLLVLAATSALRRLGKDPAPDAVRLAAAATVFGYGLFSLTDHQLDVPAHNLFFVLSAVLLISQPDLARRRRVPARVRFAVMSIGGCGVLALTFLTTRDLLARRAADEALDAYEEGNITDVVARLDTAAKWSSYDPFYLQQAAAILLTQRDRTADANSRALLTRIAKADLERARTTGAFREFSNFNLGWLALEAGEYQSAATNFAATAPEAPNRSGIYLGLGFALHALGRDDPAVRAFALEWVNDPISSTAPLWTSQKFAPLARRVATEASAILDSLAPVYPDASYTAALIRWWHAGAPAPTSGFDATSNRFWAWAAKDPHGADRELQPSPNAPWWEMLLKWRSHAAPGELRPESSGDSLEFDAAVARRVARHPPPNLHEFLTSGDEGDRTFVRETRHARPGHGVLALHPEGPLFVDLYVSQENIFVTRFFFPLFPPKGWLPGWELLKRMPAALP
jgi:O-antigen ligase